MIQWVAYVFLALGGLVWGLLSVIADDSWFRLLIALSGSVAGWHALRGRWIGCCLALLVALLVLGKVAIAGQQQNAPLFAWAGSPYWAYWTAIGSIILALVVFHRMPVLTLCLALVGAMFLSDTVVPWGGFHVAAEIFVVIALGFIWIRPGSEHVLRGLGLGRSRGARLAGYGNVGRCRGSESKRAAP